MVAALSAIDANVLQALVALRDPDVAVSFISITQLGSTLVIGGIALSVGLYLLVQKRLSYLVGLCFSVLGTIAVVFPLKEIVARARPDSLLQAYLETGFSFPSGHAALSTALFGFLAYLAWRRLSPAHGIIAAAFALLLVALIGFSRLYLGLHYLGDVLGGLVIGGLFLALGIILSEHLRRTRWWF
ncbi:phosphatase PAP2 family protein [Candidatus Uhrbacteria bacterium]|nr:phosphatase PAP2 family protein [Candidatus Uhrbacteria bacterium]